MKIMIINPNTTEEMTETDRLAGVAAASPGTEIFAVNPEGGPVSMECGYDDYLCVPGILEEIIKGDKLGMDAYVIACFGDPGLQAAREVTAAPVIGMVEASLYMAAMLAPRFSVVTTVHRVQIHLEDLIAGYGMRDKVIKVRTTKIPVLELEADPEASVRTIKEEARKAVVEDDSEAIILGCAGMAGFVEEVERELGVPVIDGVAAGVKFAEAIVGLGKKTSKYKTYAFPIHKEYKGSLSRFAWKG